MAVRLVVLVIRTTTLQPYGQHSRLAVSEMMGANAEKSVWVWKREKEGDSTILRERKVYARRRSGEIVLQGSARRV